MRKQGPATNKLVHDDIEAKTPGDIIMLVMVKYLKQLYSLKESVGFDKEFHGDIFKKKSMIFSTMNIKVILILSTNRR